MRYIKYFIKYVELNTKVASFFPFWIATLYYINYLHSPGNQIKITNFIIFFFAMLCFDMATTAINHYQALKTEKDNQSNYDSSIIKMMNELNINANTNKYIILVLIVLASVLGITLVFLSNLSVLLLGMLCFLIGIIYSYGPKPISATPFGEIFAGATMGVILPVIVLFTQYNHIPFELNPFLSIVFLPLAFLIANILLANNICDLEMDILNNRKTIVYYLGKQRACMCLNLLNISAVVMIIISNLLGFLSGIHYYLILLLLPYLIRNTNIFSKKMLKNKSFIYIVKNFIVFSLYYIVLLIISLIS